MCTVIKLTRHAVTIFSFSSIFSNTLPKVGKSTTVYMFVPEAGCIYPLVLIPTQAMLQAFIVLMSCQSFKMLKSLCCIFSVLLINILKISCKKHKAKKTHIGQRNELKVERH